LLLGSRPVTGRLWRDTLGFPAVVAGFFTSYAGKEMTMSKLRKRMIKDMQLARASAHFR
jgi:hypothetical protein